MCTSENQGNHYFLERLVIYASKGDKLALRNKKCISCRKLDYNFRRELGSSWVSCTSQYTQNRMEMVKQFLKLDRFTVRSVFQRTFYHQIRMARAHKIDKSDFLPLLLLQLYWSTFSCLRYKVIIMNGGNSRMNKKKYFEYYPLTWCSVFFLQKSHITPKKKVDTS